MTDLLAARWQMAISLAFHIVFAAVGVAMPLLMVIAEWRWLRTRDEVYLALAKRWAKGTAILFAVGAVSGTALSFELGLLWPRFMLVAGPVVGLPFALEGAAFFTEAIFLGIYLYGWTRVSPRAHLAAGGVVAASGAVAAVFVTLVNGWMNAPAGFRLESGRAVDIDPIVAMLNAAGLREALHTVLSCFAATGFAAAGIHAFYLLRDRSSSFHRAALGIALAVGGAAAFLQPISGHALAQMVARTQPVKLAALEGHFETRAGAPLRIGGWADVERRETPFAIEIPAGLSLLAFNDPGAVVRGLDAFPREDWPPVAFTHVCFDVMVGAGFAMMAISVWAGFFALRRRPLAEQPWLLRALVAAAPLGFIATEAGWMVTEVGRQPWVIQGIMRTSEAVTPMPNLWVPLAAFSALYFLLGYVVARLLREMVLETAPAPPPGEAPHAA